MSRKLGNITMHSVKDVSKLLDLSEVSVRKYLREGKIKAKKIGAKWYVANKDLKEYLLSHDN